MSVIFFLSPLHYSYMLLYESRKILGYLLCLITSFASFPTSPITSEAPRGPQQKTVIHYSLKKMTNKKVLHMFKLLMRESSKFSSYNYRNYALRRIRDSFEANRNIKDSDMILTKLEEAAANLEVIKRQVIVGHLYSTDKLVIEHQK